MEAIHLNRSAVKAGLRSRYPKADDAEIQRRLHDLVLGEELAARVYGPLEDSDLSEP